MLSDLTESLIATASREAATDDELNAAAHSFFASLKRASKDEGAAVMRSLSRHFDLPDPSRAAFLALVCGALVENGGDPSIIAKPLTARLASLLESAAELAQACTAQMPSPAESQDDDDESDDDAPDPIEQFEQIRLEVAPTMPRQAAAWQGLETFWRPAIAVYSSSGDARAAAGHLRELAGWIADYHEAGHWLQLMLGVLDREPLLVLEPDTGQGLLAQMSGVVDNFQLNTLLMDAFPRAGLLARRRVSKRVAEVARGIGPQQSADHVTSVWNLYNWQAIKPNLKLPTADDLDSSQDWIWNEGTPGDIAVFEGRRTVLLGPASYPRSWPSQRMFDLLPARLEVEKKLNKREVREWLQRLAQANSPT